MSALDHGARDVRPANSTPLRFVIDRIHLDFHSETLELVDNSLRSKIACIPELTELRVEQRGTLNVQGEKMNLSRAIVSTELHSSNHTNTKRLRSPFRFVKTAERVVIGERDCSEAGGVCRIHHSGGRKRSIRRGRVHVEIDFAGQHVRVPHGRHFL
jgi:hypothetical protein